MKKFWEVKQIANSNEAEISIYGEITSFKWDDTDTTASSFNKDLKELGDVETIHLHVNSPGGSVFEGIAIGNMLKSHKATVIGYVDALAASIASVIISSCDKVVMPENSMLMIHNPMTGLWGNANEMRKAAKDLDKMAEASVITYVSKSNGKLTDEKIKQIMDEETWLSAAESLEIGLCDEVIEANRMVACLDSDQIKQFKNLPEQIVKPVKQTGLTEEERQSIINQSKQNIEITKNILGGL